MSKIAVLTGDLVQSTLAQSPKHFVQRLHELLAEAQQRPSYGATTETFRGDGFQLSLTKPEAAAECALLLRAGLIAASPSKTERWDARIAIGFGTAARPDETFSEAHICSGRGLDQMSRSHLELLGEPEAFRLAVGVATAFVDDTINHWTISEAEAYFELLRAPDSHQAIAERLNKSRPTISKALRRAKAALLDQYLTDTARLVSLTYAS